MPDFSGLRVLSFESRRAQEIAQLIRNHGGTPVIAPSTREIESPNEAEQSVIRGILARDFDVLILMTGVGSRALLQAAEQICPRDEFLQALRQIAIVVRGPKPAAVMREFSVPFALTVPEPNTWREIVAALDENPGKVLLSNKRVAVQEHGEPSPELCAALRQRGAEVVPFRVYRWELPEDTTALKDAIREVVAKRIHVALFTSSVQFVHALKIAGYMGLQQAFLDGLRAAMVASIGPVSSQKLRENGVRIDLEPSHPRMGFLVKEAAEKCSDLLPTAQK
jgi:uroporphyrinogen-III synthase